MQRHPVEFRGKAGEYFGIWIVNVLLTLITLGVYGAWAKVRDKKYMYSNTVIDDHSFDYHATGKQIFIGRLIILVALIILGVLNAVNPILYLAGILILLLFLPLILVRALRFNARVTSYRNVRFDFVGQVGGAFKSFVFLPIANVFTLYMCSPFVTRSVHKFVTNNSRYGDRPFSFASKIGAYYTAFFICLSLAVIGTVVLSALAGGSFAMTSVIETFAQSEAGAAPDAEAMKHLMTLIIGIYLAMFLIFVPAALIYQAMVRNIHFNNTIIDERHHLKSNVHPGRFIWIVVSNTIVTALTFGLMIPWSRIRLARYMASVTALESEGSLDGYTSNVQETAGVLSAEYVDLEGFDIDVGI